MTTSVREALTQARPLATEKKIAIISDVGSGAAVVKGDSEALRRLFFILIDNAIKYTPEDGCVWVDLSSTDAVSTVSVTDSGIGIAEEDQPYL